MICLFRWIPAEVARTALGRPVVVAKDRGRPFRISRAGRHRQELIDILTDPLRVIRKPGREASSPVPGNTLAILREKGGPLQTMIPPLYVSIASPLRVSGQHRSACIIIRESHQVGTGAVDLFEYVRNPARALPLEEAVVLWRAAALQVRSFVDDGRFHTRLRIQSFEIDPKETTSSLHIVDIANIVEASRGGESVETTPWPMAAPEQTGLVAGRPGPASNIYNLGVLGYFLFTGELPFDHTAGPHLAEKIVRSGLPPIDREELDVPKRKLLNRIVRRATEKRPEDRYAGVAQLEAELALLLPDGLGAWKSSRLPLVGRVEMLRRIASLLEVARSDASSAQLFLLGESGIGKTFLWQAAEAALQKPNERWIYTKSPQTGGVPYGGFAALIEGLLDGERRRHGDDLRRLLVDHGVTDRALRIVATIVPRLGVLLGVDLREKRQPTEPRPVADDAELAAALLALTRNRAMTAIALDDLQWLDGQTLAVLRVMLCASHPNLAIVLIGRKEARTLIPPDISIQELLVSGLEESECYELLRLLSPPDPSGARLSALNRTVLARAQGNPLATINLLQVLRRGAPRRQAATVEAAAEEEIAVALPTDPEMKMLEVLARERMKEVGLECRRLVHHLSLLLPPVRLELVERIPSVNSDHLSALLAESEEALLLSVDREREEVWFFHDSVESTARGEAIVDEELVASTARLLFDASRKGDRRASFALARLLASRVSAPEESEGGQAGIPTNEMGVYEHIRARDAVEILGDAAARALELSVPADALRFAVAALRLYRLSPRSKILGPRLSLHRMAHRAAYYLDDVHAMSRHFDRIRSYGGDFDVIEARQLWIARAYSKAMFSGAMRIALQVLRGLDVLPPTADLHRLIDTARRYLKRTTPRRVFRRLMKAPHTQNRKTALIISTFHRLILPAVETERPLLPVLAYLIIRESLSEGYSDFTALAFVIWSIVEVIDGTIGTRLYSLSEYALKLAARTDNPIVMNSVRTYSLGFTATIRKPYTEAIAELFEVYQEGERIGNFEYAMDALHVHAQGLLGCGTPLEEVYRSLANYREKMSARNFDRDVRGLAKFQQAAETLAGRTGDTLRLSGSVCDEDEVWQAVRSTGDSMSVGGFHYLKAMLAIFADRPDLAIEHSRLVTDSPSPMAGMLEDSLVHFYHGMSAFRTGAVREGSTALDRFRRWSHYIPETHEHRYLALLAEQAASRGKTARATRLFARARRVALSRGYPHEAALFAERQGDVLQLNPATASAAAELLHLAQSLYAQWGAVPASDRVRKKLSWVERPHVFSPVLSDERFLSRLTSAGSSSELLSSGLEELSRFSASDTAYLTVSNLTDPSGERPRAVLVQEWGDGGTSVLTELPAGDLPADVGKLLGDLGSGEVRSETTASHGGMRPVLALRSDPSSSLSVRVCLIAKPSTPPFSAFVSARAMGALLLTASLLQLRETAETAAAQARALVAAREELLRTQEYSRVLFATLPDAFFLVDEGGALLFRNRAAEAYISRPEVSTEDVGAKPRETAVPRIVREAIGRAATERTGSTVEAQWGERYVRVFAVRPQTRLYSNAEVVYAVSISDITEAKHQEEALRRQEQQLIVSDRLASIGMLASTIAHEVSNPNYILQLNAQSLAVLLDQWRSGRTPPDEQSLWEAEKIVAHITEGTQRIEEVVQQVKQYSREGRDEEWELVEPQVICERALRFSRIMAAQYTDHLSFDPGTEVPRVRAVRGRLEQALINLIKNACESLYDASGRVTVRISYDSLAAEVAISVSDTGRGLPPQVAHRLGRPFISSRTREGGTGLGLSIVQSILDHHGGRLRITPAADEFTTVATMFLPRGDLSEPG